MAASYADRVTQQIHQFTNTAALWKLPPIYSYWNRKYVVPRVQRVSGAGSIFDAYFNAIATAAQAKGGKRTVLYSIGAGDCTVETMLAKRLRAAKITNARVICLELSPVRLERARRGATAMGVADLMEFEETDLNVWRASEPVEVFIAHHTLHHLVELETIYDAIKAAMTDESVFLTADMIGRNGHQRWPEALSWIEQLWAVMPDRYKLNFQFRSYHENYLDWDCSTSGFEGIRAQDVLPLLVERFGYDWFAGYGGVIDPFVERGYGQNLDPDDPADTGFIDLVENLNQTLLEAGKLTPTMMVASFRKGGGQSKVFAGLTPERSVRRP
jgi:hypothetical protein